MLDSGSIPLTQKLHLDTLTDSFQEGKKSSGHGSGSSADSKKKGGLGSDVPNVFQSTSSSTSYSSVVQVGTPQNLWINEKHNFP